MQIIIPMSGSGKRFVDAGYKTPKPLIEIDGKPIIEHVVNLFPGETDITFICNSKHLEETDMRSILKGISPDANILEISPHKKGPVYAVRAIEESIRDDEEVIVNYCDFSKYWDYNHFLGVVRDGNAAGAIPSYKGFHPHMLGTTNYAFMRDDDNWMLEIKEKEPFTSNRMNEYASDGTYYFQKGSYVKKYFNQLIDKDINLNGEYYVSLVYNLLVEDGLPVYIYEVEHMLQWGTPRDLEEYSRWSNYFSNISSFKRDLHLGEKSINLIPMAGRGKRFADEGYKDSKPLIDVSGKAMVVQAVGYLPKTAQYTFVCLQEHLDNTKLEEVLKSDFDNVRLVGINEVTEGQACTCKLGLENDDLDSPLLISACDNGMIWNAEAYQALLDDEEVDAIVWSFRRHPSSERNPQMYGWIKVDDERYVLGVSVKKQISDDPYNDHAIVGTFYFRKGIYFTQALEKLIEKNIRVNNEFYVDSCLNELLEAGLKLKVFEVSDYICWGTPDDLRTFEYWQRFFHKCSWHRYRKEADPTYNS